VMVIHFMEEAEQLCDRVAVVDRGRVVALDTPRALTADAGVATLDDAFLALTGRRPLRLEKARMEEIR
jgi:ABC-2 type transport system ATP-binding protein